MPTQNYTESPPFQWTKQREDAARLLAEDRLSDEQITAQVGLKERKTLSLWKRHPEFRARIESHVEAFRLAVRARGIACLERRVDQLNDRWHAMRRVIIERAEEMDGEIAGGGTGLLVRQFKSLGSGEHAETVREYHVDTGLLKELREHEKQAAQELGQWADRRELSGPGGGPIPVDQLNHLSDEDLATIEQLLDPRARTARAHAEPDPTGARPA
jgi:hypothetical protein